MARLICAGHASCDLPFTPVDRDVFDKDTHFVKDAKVLTGGDALNSSVSLARMGMGEDIRFVSVVGDDVFGKITTDYLLAHGIATDYIRVDPAAHSLVTVVLIDSFNERHFVCYGDAARKLTTKDVLSNIGEDTKYLHIGSFMSLDMLEGDNHRDMFRFAREKGIHTSFDVNFDNEGKWIKKVEKGLPYTDLMFASYDEAVALSGLRDPEEMGAFFQSKGVGSFVLKLGSKGCYATDFKTKYFIPTYTDMPVVDTTGAGDAFVAGYLYGLMNGFSMEACCILGNVQGTLAVGELGSHSGTGDMQAVRNFIKKHGALTENGAKLLANL
ncbi:MAG: carbohydrate kinase family protein [Clostridia bacterium]|nr:carbohydrate kinase family protein [Clostridia bacterium]